MINKILTIVLAVVVLAGVVYYLNLLPVAVLALFHADYQAVFLTNGQVYFGKLYKESSRYPILRNVYYLQVTQAPQPIREGEPQPQNINLVKLGGELHGPQDEMRISRNQILFIEDLKSDSRVVQAIEKFQSTNR